MNYESVDVHTVKRNGANADESHSYAANNVALAVIFQRMWNRLAFV